MSPRLGETITTRTRYNDAGTPLCGYLYNQHNARPLRECETEASYVIVLPSGLSMFACGEHLEYEVRTWVINYEANTKVTVRMVDYDDCISQAAARMHKRSTT